MSELGTYHGASIMMRKTLDWNLSRISMFEVEAVPHTFYTVGPDGFTKLCIVIKFPDQKFLHL
jgi:hypothetical protein